MRPQPVRRVRVALARLCLLGAIALFAASACLEGCAELIDPVDPHQAPCAGEPVYYGEYCCNVNAVEWKCHVEDACGAGPGDCRSLDPSELRDR